MKIAKETAMKIPMAKAYRPFLVLVMFDIIGIRVIVSSNPARSFTNKPERKYFITMEERGEGDLINY